MSIGWIRETWVFIAPPDPPITDIFGETASLEKTEKHMKNMRWWRVRVSALLFFICVLLAIAATPVGVVLSGDLDKRLDTSVQANIKKTVDELKSEQAMMKMDIAAIKSQSDQQSGVLKEILLTSTATNICRIVVRAKRETNQMEWASLRTAADIEQRKYQGLSGEFYPESRCVAGGG